MSARTRHRLAALCLGLTTLALGGCGCFRAGYGVGYGCGGAHVSVGTSDPVAGGILLGVFAGAAAFEAIFGGCRD
jgi:hypothetical protein